MKLGRRIVLRVVFVLLFTGVLLFVPAGTLDWWQAWVWLATWMVPALVLVTRLSRTDPGLLERRMRLRERDTAQKIIIACAWVLVVAVFAICGLDRRWGWSAISAPYVLAADACVLLGYLLFIRVLAENRFASRTVEIEEGQSVVTTGPYAVVRHPMYVSALLIYLSSPLALGSLRGFWLSLLFVVAIVARIRREEQLLAKELPGYRDYMATTRYRLVPGVW